MKMARIGVLFDRKAAEAKWSYGLNVFDGYIGEVLSHAGIPFEWLYETYHVLESRFDVIIIAATEEHPSATEILHRYMSKGGIVVTYGGLNHLAPSFGCVRLSPGSAGYAQIDTEWADPRPLRFLRAVAWEERPERNPDNTVVLQESVGIAAMGSAERLWKEIEGADAGVGGTSRAGADALSEVGAGGATEAVAIGVEGAGGPAVALGGARAGSSQRNHFSVLQRFAVGAGRLERWSVDVLHTIVGLQQGTRPLMEDGPPAPDGTAWLDDGLLKAEDMLEQDWSSDREVTETGAVYFAHPYADLWREAVIGHLLELVHERGKTLPFLGYWPEGIRQVAMLSHDSDRNQDEDAETTMRVLEECGIHTTWCMMKAGYSHSVHEQIVEAGHELALHFNSNVNEGGRFREEDFRRQFEWLQTVTGDAGVTSNKNHFTRFEGWGELFNWCEECGIESDQTRGPSKKGSVGFLFGTCHAYYPIAWANEHNRLYNVLEIGFLTQDLPQMTDFSVVTPFLEQVKRVEGIAHFLFHQGRIHSVDSVRLALIDLVNEAKRQGFVFWTGKQINDWERARRKMMIRGIDSTGAVYVEYDSTMERPVVWRPLLPREIVPEGVVIERKFGSLCIRG